MKEKNVFFYKIFNFILIFVTLITCVLVCYIYTPFLNSDSKGIKNTDGDISVGKQEDSNQSLEKFDLLILVNSENPLPKSYFTKFSVIEGHVVSQKMEGDLTKMLAAARSDGVPLKLNSTYRSVSDQYDLFESKVAALLSSGYTREKAEIEVNKTVSRAGYSEHHTGLAIDFSNPGHYGQNQKMWNWLEQNASQYGFILRYPKNKESITKTSYEPWHYRYVGTKDSVIIKERDLALEEYVM